MKIAFIRFPQILYENGKATRGGSEIVNQIIIDFLRKSAIDIHEFSPKNQAKLNLFGQANGLSRMFDDLFADLDKINSCDLVVTTNWFGWKMTGIIKPVVTIFHSNASAVLESVEKAEESESKLIKKWVRAAHRFGIALDEGQMLKERSIVKGEKQAAEKSTAIVAVSVFIKESIKKFYNIDNQKISIFPNPYPPAWEKIKVKKDFRELLNSTIVTRLPSDYHSFICKGIDRILEICQTIPNVTLVGATNLARYEKFFESLNRPKALVINADRDQLAKILEDSHITFHLSRCEGCQMALIESMYFGVVPISFNVGCVCELIEHGKNGFVVKDLTEARKFYNLLKSDRSLLEKMSMRARQTIKNRLSVEQIGKDYLGLFKMLTREIV